MKKIFILFTFVFSFGKIFSQTQKTDAALTTQAQTIKNETVPSANTPLRVGTMFLDDIASKVNGNQYAGVNTGGTSIAYTATVTPAIVSYPSFYSIKVKFHVNNTGASTLSLNGLPAKTIKKVLAGVVVNVAADDIVAGAPYWLIYDAAEFIIQIGGGSGGGGGGGTWGTITGTLSDQTDLNNALSLKQSSLTPTSVKTSNYTAAPGEFVPVNATGGVIGITLPTMPSEGTTIGVKIVAISSTTYVTVSSGGSDRFNIAAGPANFDLLNRNETAYFQYHCITSFLGVCTAGLWYSTSENAGTLIKGVNYLQQNVSIDGAYNVRWGDTSIPLGIFDVVAGNSGYTQFSKALLTLNVLDLTHVDAGTGGVMGELLLDATGAHLTGGLSAGFHTMLDLTATSALFTDTRTSKKGLEYAATGYVTQLHSLVDKEYADALVGGSPLSFSNGLTNTAGVVKLGGTLTGNTNINGSFDFGFGQSTSLINFLVTATGVGIYSGFTSYITMNPDLTLHTTGVFIIAAGNVNLQISGGIATFSGNRNAYEWNSVWSATAATDANINFRGTFTAASGLGTIGYKFTPALVGLGTSSVQIGLDVSPTFSGGTTPINYAARFRNSSVLFPAGTTTYAPIIIPTGTNLTTTVAGALENDGTHLYFTFANAGTRFQLDQQGGGGGSWLLTGTSTLTGVATITSNVKNQHIFNGTWTATAAADAHIQFGGTLTAASGLGVTGYVINPSLTAVGTSSVQVGLDVAPTFSGGTTPVNIAARFQNGGVIIGNFSAFPVPTIPDALLIRTDQNAATRLSIINNTSGTGAVSSIVLSNSAALSTGITLAAFSAGFTSSSLFVANTAVLGSSLSGGLNIGTQVNSPIQFWVNNSAAGAVVRNSFTSGISHWTFGSSGTGQTAIVNITSSVGVGVPTLLVANGAHINLTASVEVLNVNLNTSATVQYATGAQAILRNVLVQAPTIGFVGASVATDVATFTITGPPKAGTNATHTNAHGLLIQAGAVTSAGAAGAAFGLTSNAPTGGTVNYAGQGIGGSWLFAAGTTTYAPIIIPSGTNLTTTKAGALENNGTHLYFTFANSGTRYQLDQQSGGGITNTAANNELMKSDGTNAVPSGTFSTTAGNLIFGTGLAGATRTLAADGSATDVSLALNPKGAGIVSMVSSTFQFENVLGSPTLFTSGTGAFTVFGPDGATSPGLNIYLKAGDGGTLSGNYNGGNVTFSGGIGGGTGVPGNVAFHTGSGTFGGGSKVIFMGDAAVNPTTNPTSGGIMFVKSSDHNPYWRTPAGVETLMLGGISALTVGTTTITSGTSTRIPFNDGGVYSEDSGLTYDKTNDAITVGNARLSTTGVGNTFLGEAAGNFTLSLTGNTGIGKQTGGVLSSGYSNTLIGSQVGLVLTTGNSNTGVGTNALDHVIAGARNTGIGAGALQFTTGNDNTGLGEFAGNNITTGNNNLILGSQINAQSATSSDQLSIQNIIFGTGNSGTGTTLSTGNIGIGISAPTAKLSIAGGTTAVPPLGLTSGTNLTTPIAGAFEYNGVNLFFTPSGTTRKTASLYQVARSTAQTGANASVTTWTVGASDGTFLVSANVLVTASTTHAFTVTCTYTDEGNTSRTVTLTLSQLGGTLGTSVANAAGTVPYEGIPLHIRCKAATTITIGTTGTFTSVTYNVEGSIAQIN